MTDAKASFWTTVPGCLTAIAGVIGALAAIITCVYTIGALSQLNSTSEGRSKPTPVSTTAAPVSNAGAAAVNNPSPTGNAGPIGFPQASPSVHSSPLSSPSPTESPRPQATQVSRAIENDVGKSKTNDYYEIILENAWASSAPVHLDICNFSVPTGQKAILVRFSIRRSSQPRTNEEVLRLGYTQTTDFVLVSDQNRRLDPSCLVNGIVLGSGDSPVTRTLAYLVPATSQSLSFRFQKSGGGQPIVFDLAGL